MKRMLAAALALVCAASVFWMTTMQAVAVEAPTQEDIVCATALQEMGLLKGDGNDLELDRNMTRAEAAVMLVRLSGKESEVLKGVGLQNAPFTDVPNWASNYIDFMWTNGYTKGTSATTFSPNDTCTVQEYTLFLLRALKYPESAVTYNQAMSKAAELKLTREGVSATDPITRGTMANLSWKALYSPMMSSSDYTLKNYLEDNGAFDKETSSDPVMEVPKERSAEEFYNSWDARFKQDNVYVDYEFKVAQNYTNTTVDYSWYNEGIVGNFATTYPDFSGNSSFKAPYGMDDRTVTFERGVRYTRGIDGLAMADFDDVFEAINLKPHLISQVITSKSTETIVSGNVLKAHYENVQPLMNHYLGYGAACETLGSPGDTSIFYNFYDAIYEVYGLYSEDLRFDADLVMTSIDENNCSELKLTFKTVSLSGSVKPTVSGTLVVHFK